MPIAFRPLPRSLVVLILTLLVAPRIASAQKQWTRIGIIGGTEMYMDTTTIIRTDRLRKVWVKSVDVTSKQFVAGTDTLEFDTVIGLNVFDCSHHTRTVAAVRYLLGDSTVFEVPFTHGGPEALRPRSFFDAIYNDLCGEKR